MSGADKTVAEGLPNLPGRHFRTAAQRPVPNPQHASLCQLCWHSSRSTYDLGVGPCTEGFCHCCFRQGLRRQLDLKLCDVLQVCLYSCC